MTIPATIVDYFKKKDIPCAIVSHPYSSTSLESAHAAHVDADSVAKGVLLADSNGYVLAVVPATHNLQLPQLEKHVGTHLELAPEENLTDAFEDCLPGAVPALGCAYYIRTVVDPVLAKLPDVYFEAGDHEDLIHVSAKDFGTLMAEAEFASISEHR